MVLNRTKFFLPFLIFLASNYSNADLPAFSCSTGNTFIQIVGQPIPKYGYVSLPFTFYYLGRPDSDVTICECAYIIMGRWPGYCSFNNDLCNTYPRRAVCAYWDDLLPSSNDIQWTILGTAPGRVFVAQYLNVPFFSGTGRVTVQVKLYETSNVIEFLYGPAIYNPNASGSIGITDGIGGSGHFISVTPGLACSTTTVSKTICNNNVPYNSNIGPGVKYTFTPQPEGIVVNNEVPSEFKLYQNYPNPFNPVTKIRFDIASVETIHELSLRIYDVLGREVATLVNESLKSGTYEIEWDATNYPSGVYFYKLKAGDYSEAKRMILLR